MRCRSRSFSAVWSPQWSLNDAYAVELTYAWGDGDPECAIPRGWCIERVVVLGTLAALDEEACDEWEEGRGHA